MEIAAKSMDRLCKQHLATQGITSKETLQHRLQVIFEESDHQQRALIALYRMLIPDWDRLQQLEGFPVVGQELWKYICQLFIDFDQHHHPDVFKGGLWINQGFSSCRNLGPWEINLDHCRFIYA
jgi:hypothetical protein